MQNGQHQGWQAKLETGEWVYESPPVAPGELSAWQLLLIRCKAENLRMTHLQIVRGPIKISALARCDGYMQAYEARRSNLNHTTTILQGVGSVIGDKVFINWIAADFHVSQEVRDLKSVWVHTTNRELVDVLTPKV